MDAFNHASNKQAYLRLIDVFIEKRILRTSLIIEAFKHVDRKDFLPALLKEEAGVDTPLSIGYGQTISQPYTVAFMMELLQPKPGNKALDIGSGSGFTSALLAYIVSNGSAKGSVYAMEVIPELCLFGKENVEAYNFVKKGIVSFFCEDASEGLEKHAPFDRIIASAGADTLPRIWLSQLADKGRLVAPIRGSIWLYEKRRGNIRKIEFPGFLFVPLVATHHND